MQSTLQCKICLFISETVQGNCSVGRQHVNKLWEGEKKYDRIQKRGTYLYTGENIVGKFDQRSVGKGTPKQINLQKSLLLGTFSWVRSLAHF